jgi:hypothetical protein
VAGAGYLDTFATHDICAMSFGIARQMGQNGQSEVDRPDCHDNVLILI